MREHNIVVLKGDGIGPEIVDEAVKVLDAAGKKYGFKMNYDYELMGGCAIDETGEPLPQKTVDACKKADCVFLGAVGGPKWDGVPGNKRPRGRASRNTRCARTLCKSPSCKNICPLKRCVAD